MVYLSLRRSPFGARFNVVELCAFFSAVVGGGRVIHLIRLDREYAPCFFLALYDLFCACFYCLTRCVVLDLFPCDFMYVSCSGAAIEPQRARVSRADGSTA